MSLALKLRLELLTVPVLTRSLTLALPWLAQLGMLACWQALDWSLGLLVLLSLSEAQQAGQAQLLILLQQVRELQPLAQMLLLQQVWQRALA